jgi:hypothetical protein
LETEPRSVEDELTVKENGAAAAQTSEAQRPAPISTPAGDAQRAQGERSVRLRAIRQGIPREVRP